MALSPEKYGEASCLFDDKYLENLNRIEVRTSNDYCRCVY